MKETGSVTPLHRAYIYDILVTNIRYILVYMMERYLQWNNLRKGPSDAASETVTRSTSVTLRWNRSTSRRPRDIRNRIPVPEVRVRTREMTRKLALTNKRETIGVPSAIGDNYRFARAHS